METDVFISYSSKDKIVADAICHSLEERGISCWMAPRDVMPGETYAHQIVQAIKNCSLVVLVLSPNANHSEHVVNEIDSAFTARKPIVPFVIEETTVNDDLNYYLGRKHWLIAYPDYREKTESLVETILRLSHRDNQALNNGTECVPVKRESAIPEQNLPPTLSFSYQDKTLWFFLSPDKTFYIGNLQSRKKDLSWIAFNENKEVFAAALMAGAAGFAGVSLGLLLPVAAGLVFLRRFFHNGNKMAADSYLCQILSKATGYKFDLPSDEEKQAAIESARPYCVVIRVKDNPALMALAES